MQMVLIENWNVYGISIADEHQISKYLAALVTLKFEISGVFYYYNFSENLVKVENYVIFNSVPISSYFSKNWWKFQTMYLQTSELCVI